MKKSLLLGVLLFLFSIGASVAEIAINCVSSCTSPERTRLVFDVSAQFKYKITPAAGASSLTLLIRQSQLKAKVPTFRKHKVISSVSARSLGNRSTEVTFRLKRAVRVKSFQLDPGGRYGYRLVLDLYDREEK